MFIDSFTLLVGNILLAIRIMQYCFFCVSLQSKVSQNSIFLINTERIELEKALI